MPRLTFCTVAAMLLCCAGVVAAQPVPVFGPQTFERTTGQADLYTQSFEVPAAGPFLLFLRNGDGEASRVASAKVEINSATVVGPSDLNPQLPGLSREIDLEGGINELVVELTGEPGSFIALAVVRPGEEPIFVFGRLLLPWGNNGTERELALALKNGSHRAPRALRVVFFASDGDVVGGSQRIVLPPRGSLAAIVDDLITAGGFEIGSVEVFYAGPGTARLFGTARHLHLPTGITEIQPLEQAGLRVFRATPESSEVVRRLRRLL